jgi:hypothetical protein
VIGEFNRLALQHGKFIGFKINLDLVVTYRYKVFFGDNAGLRGIADLQDHFVFSRCLILYSRR